MRKYFFLKYSNVLYTLHKHWKCGSFEDAHASQSAPRLQLMGANQAATYRSRWLQQRSESLAKSHPTSKVLTAKFLL